MFKKLWTFVVPLVLITGIAVTVYSAQVMKETGSPKDKGTDKQAARDITEKEAADLTATFTRGEDLVPAVKDVTVGRMIELVDSLIASAANDEDKAVYTKVKERIQQTTWRTLDTQAIVGRYIAGAMLKNNKGIIDTSVADVVKVNKEDNVRIALFEIVKHEVEEMVALQNLPAKPTAQQRKEAHTKGLNAGNVALAAILGLKNVSWQAAINEVKPLNQEQPGKVYYLRGTIDDNAAKSLAEPIDEAGLANLGENDIVLGISKDGLASLKGKTKAKIFPANINVQDRANVYVSVVLARLFSSQVGDEYLLEAVSSVIGNVSPKKVQDWRNQFTAQDVAGLQQLFDDIGIASKLEKDWISRVQKLNDVLGKL